MKKKLTTNKEVSDYLAQPHIAKMFDHGDLGDYTLTENVLFYEMRQDGVQPGDVGEYEQYDETEFPPGLLDRYKANLVKNPM